jgi:hypothetical protein
MTSQHLTVVVFAWPSCAAVYNAKQYPVPDLRFGLFNCLACRTQVYAWNGLYDLVDRGGRSSRQVRRVFAQIKSRAPFRAGIGLIRAMLPRRKLRPIRPVGSPWPTRGMICAPYKLTSVIATSSTRFATPSWRRIGSRTFGGESNDI